MDRRSVPRPEPDFLTFVKRHRTRWEDEMQLLNDVVASTLGVRVRETVPAWTESPIERAC